MINIYYWRAFVGLLHKFKIDFGP